MKLSKTQQELLLKMQAGKTLYYMPYLGNSNRQNDYFVCEISRSCTAAAKALINKGLVKLVGKHWEKKCELTDAGKAWEPTETERRKNGKQIND